jgi:hypothetical protein
MRSYRVEIEGTLPLILCTTPLVPRAIVLLEKTGDAGHIIGTGAVYGFPSDAEIASSRQATYTTSGQTINCCLHLFDCLDASFARAGETPTVSYRQRGSNIVTLMHDQSRASVQRVVEGSVDLRRIVYPVAEALYGVMRDGGPATAAMRQTVASAQHIETEPVVIGKRKRDDSSLDDGESLGTSSASGSNSDEDDLHMEISHAAAAVAPITTVRDDGNHRAVHSMRAIDGRTMCAVDIIHRTMEPTTARAVGNLLALLERGIELLAGIHLVDSWDWAACRIDLCTQSVNPLLLPAEHARCVGLHHREAYVLWGCSMEGASMHIPPDAPILRHLAYPKDLYKHGRSPYDGAIILLYARRCMMVHEEDCDPYDDDDAYGLLAARAKHSRFFGQTTDTLQVQEDEIERMLSRIILSTMSVSFEDQCTYE